MTRVAFLDASAGIAGDMCLGALVDAGLPLDVLQDMATRLELGDLRVTAEPVDKHALRAVQVEVRLDGKPIEGPDDAHAHVPSAEAAHTHTHAHRTLADVLSLLERLGDVSTGPLAQAASAFRALAEAEGRVHGQPPEAVHFHEVGAADALVDIAGTCLGLAHLGVERVYVSPLPWSTGTVQAAHGTLPLPAPATARLMAGHPTTGQGEAFEQVTPTGAALVRVLAAGTCPPAGFVPETTGLGAGHHPGGALPNVVRLVIGTVQEAGAPEDVVELATNLDDATAQVTAHAMSRVLEAGALDAWIVPTTMKKGRAGAVLHVLAEPADVGALEAVLFAETPTLGIRRHPVSRHVLTRRHVAVETPYGEVRMKVRETPTGPAATPEYEDARALAEAGDVPLQAVLDAAQHAWSATQRS